MIALSFRKITSAAKRNQEWKASEILNGGKEDEEEGIDPANAKEREVIGFHDQFCLELESESFAWAKAGNRGIVEKGQL